MRTLGGWVSDRDFSSISRSKPTAFQAVSFEHRFSSVRRLSRSGWEGRIKRDRTLLADFARITACLRVRHGSLIFFRRLSVATDPTDFQSVVVQRGGRAALKIDRTFETGSGRGGYF